MGSYEKNVSKLKLSKKLSSNELAERLTRKAQHGNVIAPTSKSGTLIRNAAAVAFAVAAIGLTGHAAHAAYSGAAVAAQALSDLTAPAPPSEPQTEEEAAVSALFENTANLLDSLEAETDSETAVADDSADDNSGDDSGDDGGGDGCGGCGGCGGCD